MNVRSEIEYNDNKAETGTCWTDGGPGLSCTGLGMRQSSSTLEENMLGINT